MRRVPRSVRVSLKELEKRRKLAPRLLFTHTFHDESTLLVRGPTPEQIARVQRKLYATLEVEGGILYLYHAGTKGKHIADFRVREKLRNYVSGTRMFWIKILKTTKKKHTLKPAKKIRIGKERKPVFVKQCNLKDRFIIVG